MTVAPQNKCRPEWRNLSPREECELRGRGEVPGRLPKAVDNTAALNLAEHRREVIMTAIMAGSNTRAQLRRITHGAAWVDGTIEALAIQKRITARHSKNSVRYEVAG